MSKPIPLDEQIVAVLTNDCTSTAAASVLALAEASFADLNRQADQADVDSLSPLATSAEANAHRRKAADLRFESDRMDASISALRARVADLKDAERRARDKAARDAAIEERDALAADIARDYPKHVRALTVLVKRIMESDARLRTVGVNESAEAIGRGVPASFYKNMAHIPRLQDAQLPMPAGDGRCAWSFDGYNSHLTYRGLELASAEEIA